MTTFQTLPRLAWLLVAFSLIVAPLAAQRRRPTTAAPQNPVVGKATQPEPAPTFDALLAADSYKIYGEVRGLGQLIRSSGVNDLLDPVMKLAAPPKEFKTIVKWLNTHADAVMTSRLMFAAWPARAKLPKFLCAIEFPSAEEAQKFEPQLREFLPRVVPTPMPSPTTSPGPASPKTEPPASERKETGVPGGAAPLGWKTGVPGGAVRGPQPSISAGGPYPLGWTNEPAPPPYLIKQSGALVLISDSPFAIRNLRPRGSKLLTEDLNFRLVRDRFTSESIFFYFDVQLEDKANPRPTPSESPTAVTIAETEKQEDSNDNKEAEPETPAEEVQPTPALTESPAATLGGQSSQGQTGVLAGAGHSAAGPSKEPEPVSMLPYLLSSALFGGTPQWPEAVGAAIAFDADSYVVRTLLVNGPDNKASAIPFIPQLISGPALVPESPAIFPADTELFVAASLDYPQIYEGMTKTIASQNEETRRRTRQTIKNNEPESPFVFYEKKLGIKIKEDLLPLLGNEIALTIPVKTLNAGTPQPSASPAPEESRENSNEIGPQPSGPSLVVAISVKDKEGVQRLIPKIIESLGFKGANLLAQTDKRDDTELVSYADVLSYAFIGNFLVVSPDVAATRHVVDSYLNHQSLAANTHFRNFTRWQPQQVLGQIYVSPALMESYNSVASDTTSPLGNKMRDFMARIGPIAEPVTYALSYEGMGPLHELHIPKNLLLLMIAGISSEASESPLLANEAVAKSVLRTVASAEATYQATKGQGSFCSLDELISEGLVSKELIRNYGYKIEVTVSSNKFEVSAVPVEYGKTGKSSYFLDESSVLRSGDHGGGPATISDKPVQ